MAVQFIMLLIGKVLCTFAAYDIPADSFGKRMLNCEIILPKWVLLLLLLPPIKAPINVLTIAAHVTFDDFILVFILYGNSISMSHLGAIVSVISGFVNLLAGLAYAVLTGTTDYTHKYYLDKKLKKK